ncbi:MAG TPA: hypothetical protein VI485_03010 [Vicinamibacterales bacterium]|nr:hypothetical protein [Vicinamibacterales bacterium]
MIRSTSWVAAMILLGASAAYAQPSSVPRASRPAVAGVLGGFSGGAGDTGGSTGGTLSFDITDRVGLEGRGIYMQRGGGSTGLEVTGTMLLTLARSERAAPYVAIGGGFYRARFDMGDNRFFGQMGSAFAAGTRFVPIRGMTGFGMMNSGMTFNGDLWTDAWTGATFTDSQMPMFYANRIGQMAIPTDGRWGMRSFTDPALTLGGGIRLDVTDRVSIRPDVRALVAFANSDRLLLTTMTVGVGYRF